MNPDHGGENPDIVPFEDNEEEEEEESDEEEETDDEEEDDDDGVIVAPSGGGGSLRMLPPPNPASATASMSSSSLMNHHNHSHNNHSHNHHSSHNQRKSFPPAKSFRAPPAALKAADEMIGVSVPRRARSGRAAVEIEKIYIDFFFSFDMAGLYIKTLKFSFFNKKFRISRSFKISLVIPLFLEMLYRAIAYLDTIIAFYLILL